MRCAPMNLAAWLLDVRLKDDSRDPTTHFALIKIDRQRVRPEPEDKPANHKPDLTERGSV